MYNVVLVGLGAANSLLLMRMKQEGLLDHLAVLILDPNNKRENDKTFCFWAQPNEPIVQDLALLIRHSWSKIHDANGVQELGGMRYYMVESETLYKRARAIAKAESNVNWVSEEVQTIEDLELYFQLVTNKSTYKALRVYDSRPPKISEEIGSILWQSFVGWKVRFDRPMWSGNTMRLMDFIIPQHGSTQFIYVLPTSDREALVEITRFGCESIQGELATNLLHTYLEEFQNPYEVLAIERGKIPMSQHAKEEHVNPRNISTGVRAGKMKPSTGYAFKNMYLHAQELVKNELENSFKKSLFSGSGRFAYYDFLLLFILKFRPQWGKPIFLRLFQGKPYQEVFEFLEEKSSLSWEIGMFWKLNKRKFLWSVLFSSLAYISVKPQRGLPIVFSLFALGLHAVFPAKGLEWSMDVLVLLLFAVGIPHGALDGYTHQSNSRLVHFIVRYLGMMALVGSIWWISPVLGLTLFLLYSAWHFGETDLKEWQGGQPLLSILWGMMVLAILMLPHLEEVRVLLSYMNVTLPAFPNDSLISYVWGTLALGGVLAMRFRSAAWGLSVLSLAVGTQLPVLLSFGIYFILQHSLTGWNHLKVEEGWTHAGMFKKALPFTAGATLLFLVLFQFEQRSFWQWSSYFLAFLSALSLPHIYFMSRLYRQA